MLAELYKLLYGSDQINNDNLNDLARRLSQIAGKNPPWQHRYLLSILRGHKNVRTSKQLSRAINILGGMVDGLDAIEARARRVVVYSLNGTRDGALIRAHCKPCKSPGCRRWIISDRFLYCSDDCRRRWRNEKRRQARRAK